MEFGCMQMHIRRSLLRLLINSIIRATKCAMSLHCLLYVQLVRMEVEFFTSHIKNGPVMSRSYFKKFWIDCCDAITLDISDEGPIFLQLVTEHHAMAILEEEQARNITNLRITNIIKTTKALQPFLSTDPNHLRKQLFLITLWTSWYFQREIPILTLWIISI